MVEGSNTIVVKAQDKAGNTTTETENLFLDTNKPKLTILSGREPFALGFSNTDKPPPPPKSKQIKRIVRGFIIDPTPSSGIKRIIINGREVALKSDNSFETRLTVSFKELARLSQKIVLIFFA